MLFCRLPANPIYTHSYLYIGLYHRNLQEMAVLVVNSLPHKCLRTKPGPMLSLQEAGRGTDLRYPMHDGNKAGAVGAPNGCSRTCVYDRRTMDVHHCSISRLTQLRTMRRLLPRAIASLDHGCSGLS